MNLKHSIPNAITLGNLACGFMAILLAASGHLHLAGACVLLGAVLDFFDGLAARLLDAKSPIGAQLDSLSDLVTFGLAPAIIMYQFISMLSIPEYLELLKSLQSFDSLVLGADQANYWSTGEYITASYNLEHSGGFWGLNRSFNLFGNPLGWGQVNWQIALMCVLYPIAGAYRLAKFNTLPPSNTFRGLAIPAAALFLVSCPLIFDQELMTREELWKGMLNYNVYLGVVVLAALLMVLDVPMFSLKMKNLSWKDNAIQYIFVALSVVMVVLSLLIKNLWLSIPLIILLYIILSLLNNLINKNHEIQS